jgi:hypothetical protein
VTTLQIGRFGVDPVQSSVFEVAETATGIQVSGRLSSNDGDVCRVMAGQLLALQDNPWEPVVPVVIDTVPELNGFYVVNDVSVTLEGGGLANGVWPFSVSLDQVSSHRSPLTESYLFGIVRPNSYTITSGYPVARGPVASGGVFVAEHHRDRR